MDPDIPNQNQSEEQLKEEAAETSRNLFRLIWRYLRRVTDIKQGTDEDQTMEGIVRDIDFKGPNLWILALSILICSIGLNTNSTAVIIGAMLISPLMGPILGAGLSIGINDFSMLKRSARSLLNAVIISVITSTLYFWISPLHDAQSELLARTNPTLFDVLIATFGGLAGIIAGSRKEKSNVIPGVAIATALMPPLCTAGYGLGTGQIEFFFGAFYLFFINAVFIFFSTFLVVRWLGFKKKQFVDRKVEKRVRVYIGIFIVLTMGPSLWLGYGVVRQSIFNARASTFVADNIRYDGIEVISTKFTYDDEPPKIEITLIGEILGQKEISSLRNRLSNYDLEGSNLVVHQSADATSRIAEQLNKELRVGIIEDLYKKNEEALASKDEQIRLLEQALETYQGKIFPLSQVASEMRVHYPMIDGLALGTLPVSYTKSLGDTITVALVSGVDSNTNVYEMSSWLEVRLNQDSVKVISIAP